MPHQAEPTLKRLQELSLFPEGATWVELTDGTINRVWKVEPPGGDPVLVRVGPSRREAEAGPSWMRADALACEAIVLDRVHAEVTGLPVTVASGFRDRERTWLVQTVVPGQPMDQAVPHLCAMDRACLWRALGAITRRLHRIPGTWFGTPDGRQRYPDWSSMVHADAMGMLEDAGRYRLNLRPFQRLLERIEVYRDALAAVPMSAVVHSDLDARHVFVSKRDGGWEITGVIDWEYARYADPHSESLLVAMLARPDGDPDHESFLAGYGLGDDLIADPSFQARQTIYRGIAEGWALTDEARLKVREETGNARRT